jgi:hypothetical protein
MLNKKLRHLSYITVLFLVAVSVTSCGKNRSAEDEAFCENKAYCDTKADYLSRNSSKSGIYKKYPQIDQAKFEAFIKNSPLDTLHKNTIINRMQNDSNLLPNVAAAILAFQKSQGVRPKDYLVLYPTVSQMELVNKIQPNTFDSALIEKKAKEVTDSLNRAEESARQQRDTVEYDVICFLISLWTIKCNPETTLKIPRGSEIEFRITKETSVQNGVRTSTTFYHSKAEKISVSEMESLASNGSNVYAASNENDMIWVYLFTSKNGRFQLFERQNNNLIFRSGDTSVRIK